MSELSDVRLENELVQSEEESSTSSDRSEDELHEATQLNNGSLASIDQSPEDELRGQIIPGETNQYVYQQEYFGGSSKPLVKTEIVWIEIVWVTSLINSMIILLIGLFMYYPWVYGPAYLVHHFALVLGYIKLPKPSLPARIYEQISYRFPSFPAIMRALALIVCLSLAILVVSVFLLWYSRWQHIIPDLLIYFFGIYVPMITYCLIVHSYPRRLISERVDIC